MICFIAVAVVFTSGYGLITPMTKPDGSLDVSSLISHITLLESKTTTDITDLKSQLQTALSELTAAQTELITVKDDLKGVQSDLKSTQIEVGVLHSQLTSGNSQCSCNTSTQSSNRPGSAYNGRVTFTRWGRTTCPTNTKLIYKGTAGGTSGQYPKSATILCMPEHPIYDAYDRNGHGVSIYSIGYSTSYTGNPFKSVNNKRMACVVCEAEPKTAVIMVPARNQCYAGWNLEYSGYLMGADHLYSSAEYICVDKDPEVAGSNSNESQDLLIAEVYCDPFTCPPYKHLGELTCAVCSK